MDKKKGNNNTTEFSGIKDLRRTKEITGVCCIIITVLIASPFIGSAATPTYTGCVNVTGTPTMSKGMMYNINAGTSPSAACKSGDYKASFSAGDVTGVKAGSGLSGGGQAGNVTLVIATGGVTRNMIANNAITTEKILNGSIRAEDLSNGTALSEIKDNDGSGSGLDADLLDGKHAGSFAASSHNHDSRYAKSNQSCAIGEVVTGIDAGGNLMCNNTSSTAALEARIAKLEGLLNRLETNRR